MYGIKLTIVDNKTKKSSAELLQQRTKPFTLLTKNLN